MVPTCGGHWSVDLASVLLLVEVWVWYGGRSSSTLRRNAIVHLVHWSSLVITGHHWSQGAHKRLRFPHPMAWHGMSPSDESHEEMAHSVSQTLELNMVKNQKLLFHTFFILFLYLYDFKCLQLMFSICDSNPSVDFLHIMIPCGRYNQTLPA